MNRRDFFRVGAASAAVAGGGFHLIGSPRGDDGTSAARKARNVIVLVSDGMSSGTMSFADQFIRWRDGRASHWIDLYERGVVRRGLMETASLNSLVTDSAAAASSWGSGHRVENGAINVGPDGETYPTICGLAREAGKSTGLVTTARLTHATPAGFAANMADRNEEARIA